MNYHKSVAAQLLRADPDVVDIDDMGQACTTIACLAQSIEAACNELCLEYDGVEFESLHHKLALVCTAARHIGLMADRCVGYDMYGSAEAWLRLPPRNAAE